MTVMSTRVSGWGTNDPEEYLEVVEEEQREDQEDRDRRAGRPREEASDPQAEGEPPGERE
jgi:hypothetical protein